jgi:hypothetical protein
LTTKYSVSIRGGHYHKDRDSLVLNRRQYVILTNPALIASVDAKRIAKITAIDAKKENALRKKDAAAARLAAGVIPRKRAKNSGVIEPVDVEPVIEPDDADVETVDD